MTADLLTTTAAIWMLAAVTAGGVAVLPWTDGELGAAIGALASVPGWVRVRVTRSRQVVVA
ncbi:MAG: hypothetical protein H6735_13780 [Alphaproteobacteria bacterium]|nr:hypothetical protein [Alphaproteobacteria bacterium]